MSRCWCTAQAYSLLKLAQTLSVAATTWTCSGRRSCVRLLTHRGSPLRDILNSALCSDNLDVFRQNGFEFRDEPGSGRLLLTAVPFRCVWAGRQPKRRTAWLGARQAYQHAACKVLPAPAHLPTRPHACPPTLPCTARTSPLAQLMWRSLCPCWTAGLHLCWPLAAALPRLHVAPRALLCGPPGECCPAMRMLPFMVAARSAAHCLFACLPPHPMSWCAVP